ncbi:MAG TPA: hypothetical protein VF383_06950 [Candidatus Dormibacteraeota bacterium]
MSQSKSVIRLTAASGMAGTLALAAYFAAPAFLDWPFGGASPARLSAYAVDHQVLFYAGAWLQSTGTLLCVIFFLALVRMTGAAGGLSATLVIVSAASLLSIVLVESAFMVAVPMAASAGDTSTVATSFALSNGVFVRIFPLAPSSATYIALGLALLSRGPLHRGFGYAAITIGAAFELGGIVAIFSSLALVVLAVLAAGQALWVAAAAVALWRSAP